MRAAIDVIEGTLADLTKDLEIQAAGDSVIAIERQRIEGLIKNIYYADQQNEKKQGGEDKKAQIRALVEEFAA